MPQEPRTRRGFLRAAGLLAGGTAVAAIPQAGAAQVVTAGQAGAAQVVTGAGEAGAVLSAGHARTLGALAETAAELFPALVPEHSAAATAARYASLPPTDRERVRRAAEALGSDLAELTREARIARLGSRLNGPQAADVETTLGLLAEVPPGDGRTADGKTALGLLAETPPGDGRTADVETALGLLAEASPGDGRVAVDEERGRLLGRALRAAAGAGAPAAPAEPISPFVV